MNTSDYVAAAAAGERLQQVLDKTTAAALAVSGAKAGRVCEDLVQSLATILDTDAALIGEFIDADRARMRTLAVWYDGRLLQNFDYEVAHSPCRHIVGRDSRFVADGVHGEFAPGTLFAEQGFDAYAGYSLFDARERQIGLIVALSRRRMADQALTEALMKIFAVRAAAEIERRRAADALEISETSYRAIFEAAQDAMFVHDWDSGAIVDVNPRACEVYGYTREEMLQASPADLSSNVPPYTFAEATRHIEAAKAGRTVRLEWHRRNKDGSLHWDEVVIQRVELGGVRRILALTREITERKAAEQALRASEVRLRATVDAALDCVLVVDEAGRVVEFNPAAEATFGRCRDDVIGREMAVLLIPPRLRDGHREGMRRAQAGGTKRMVGRRVEMAAMRADGTEFPVEMAIAEVEVADGRMYVGYLRDITERKRTEAALRDSEALYRGLFNASADAMVLRDADFRVVDVNPSYTTMSGYTREETIGIDHLLTVGEDENGQWRRAHRRMLAGEQLRFEFAARRKDGTPYEAEVRGMPVSWNNRPHVLYVTRDITDRKRAERALAASEEQYRGIFNASADALVLWNSELRVVDVNPAYLRIYKRRREDVVGFGYPAHYPREYVERRQQLIRRALAGEACELQTQAYRANGELFEVEWRVVPVLHRGEPHALAVARDITERKRAEQALAASEEQYRGIFNASADALVLWNSELRIVDVNPAFLRIYGFTREQILGTGYPTNFPADYVEERLQLVRRALAGEACELQTQAFRADGSRFEVDLRVIPIMHRGVPHVLAIGRDITERKRAEVALRSSEEQYRAIFESSVDGLLLWDVGHRIVDANRAFLTMHGYEREELVGSTGPVFIPPELQGQCADLLPSILAGTPCHMEARSRRRDGTELDVEIHGVPVLYQGKPHVLIVLRDITERKRAEVALKLREEQYRVIFDGSADALVLWNEDILIVDANRAFTQMYGFAREEVIGITLDSRLPPEGVAKRVACIRAALQGQERVLETETMGKSGESFFVELRYLPITHLGRPHVLAIARDITERKAAEARLRASEEQYRAIFNASADALILWDSSYRRVDVNPAYEKTYGRSREEVIGKGYEHPSFPPEYVQPRHELVRRALAGESCRAELEAIRKDGERIRTEVHAIPFRHRGEPHVLAIARDITERRLVEERLRASEEQYREIFAASADAMVLRDENLRVVDVNPAFLAMICRPKEEIVGRVQPAFVIAPEREAAEQLLRDALAGHSGRLEVRTVSGDGVEREVDLRTMPMQYQGRPHVLAIARDVTAERRAERESRRLEAQLRQAQKMEAIGQLTGGIAHDFNNILASVMGYVVLAEERASDQDDAKSVDYLGQALSSCRRARDLIQQMLTFSRGGRGEPRAVDLVALVRETAPMLRASLPPTLELALDCDDAVPPVWIDEVQAHQVLLNLAINARDAMAGAGRITIGVRRRAAMATACSSCRHALAGDFVELSVADRGAGITPDLIERIFDPFFTTKAPGKGSGMGLSTVHGIVHEYGGHVVVDSTPGSGAVFRVLWPASAAIARIGPAAEMAVRRRRRLSGRVLLVDDEPAVLGSMRETMLNWGLQVDAHAQPEAALAAFESAPDAYDVVVTDLAMPHISGLDLAARLLARRRLPILLVSGYVDERGLAAASELGLRAPLRKPVETNALRAAIESALGDVVAAGADVRHEDG